MVFSIGSPALLHCNNTGQRFAVLLSRVYKQTLDTHSLHDARPLQWRHVASSVETIVQSFRSRLRESDQTRVEVIKMVRMGGVEPVAQVFLGAGVTTAFHPFSYTKTLVQLGYEPLPPVPTTNLFGKNVLAYPNVFQYLGHIRKLDGFVGMYRGLFPRLICGAVGSFVTNSCQIKLKTCKCLSTGKEGGEDREEDEEEEEEDGMTKMLKQTTIEMLSRCAGVIVSHPFHVIMVRSMAQFIGRETAYDTIISSVREIYNKDGVLGFFVAIAPRLVCEVLTVWLANLMAYTLNEYVVPLTEGVDTRHYTSALCSLAVTQVTYPLNLISNIMAVNNCGLKAGSSLHMDHYTDWMDCGKQLARQHQLKRGSSLFWRYYKGPVISMSDGGVVPLY
ncbi:hypothetical protein LSAT2_029340 [Lamellibrachia satsuma]|nr:hypothetical protein LSAT2_029340 [Lamellibrachia satsuma]